MKESLKIVLAGLDQAGKTSILNILNQSYNLMDNIKPTVGLVRSTINILGVPIINFDLGGQIRYREEYLTNLKVFDYTDSLVFIIDALNDARYEEAFEYYEQIIKVYNNFLEKPKIVILIHKVDPNLRDDPRANELIEILKQQFIKSSSGYELSTYVTSIYDRKSIVQAFSKSIQELIPPLKPFKSLLKSLVTLLKLDGAILFDENLLILSEYYLSEEIEKVFLETVYNSVFYMRTTNPKLTQNLTLNFEIILEFKNLEKRFNFIEVQYKDVWKLYLLTMGTQKWYSKTLREKFNLLLKDFEETEETS